MASPAWLWCLVPPLAVFFSAVVWVLVEVGAFVILSEQEQEAKLAKLKRRIEWRKEKRDGR